MNSYQKDAWIGRAIDLENGLGATKLRVSEKGANGGIIIC